MSVVGILSLVFGAGCVGGLVNAVVSGGFARPALDKEAGVWRPGWLGNILVGGVAAVVFWGLYGPLSATVAFGGDPAATAAGYLRVGEFCGALVSGIGGGRLLISEVEKRVLEKEKEALDHVKNDLAGALSDLQGAQ